MPRPTGDIGLWLRCTVCYSKATLSSSWVDTFHSRSVELQRPLAAALQGLIEGTNKEVTPWVCDVRDIARAHVLAAEVPTAKGRYGRQSAGTTRPS